MYVASSLGESRVDAFWVQVDHVYDLIFSSKTPEGFLPLEYSKVTGKPQGGWESFCIKWFVFLNAIPERKYTIGAFADSGYGYLLKQWMFQSAERRPEIEHELKTHTTIDMNASEKDAETLLALVSNHLNESVNASEPTFSMH